MKRSLRKISLYVGILAMLTVAVAQGVSEVIGEVLGTNWGALFTEGTVLAGAIIVIIKLVDTIRPGLLAGPGKYFAALILGIGVGVAGDYAGYLTVPEYSGFPTPLAGLTFGLAAALSAVGIHQGKTQTAEALREISTRRLG